MVVLIFTATSGPTLSSNPPTGEQASLMHTWTVAKVVETKDADFQKVVFLESARFYKLMRSNKNFDCSLGILREAEKNQSTVKVWLTEPHGDIIERVEK